MLSVGGQVAAYATGLNEGPAPPEAPPRFTLSIARHQAPLPGGRLLGSDREALRYP